MNFKWVVLLVAERCVAVGIVSSCLQTNATKELSTFLESTSFCLPVTAMYPYVYVKFSSTKKMNMKAY